jgi:membrane protein DedA with SNARE-associated domain
MENNNIMENLSQYLQDYGYIVLFLYSFGGGMLALIIASTLAFAGILDFTIVLITAFVANFIGDTFLFYIAKTNKKDVMQYIKKHRRKLALSHIYMKKCGNLAIFIQKYVYGIKTLIPVAIGLTNYKFKTFVFYNFLATILWTVVVGFGSYFASDILLDVFKTLEKNPEIGYSTLILLIGAFIFFINKATKK